MASGRPRLCAGIWHIDALWRQAVGRARVARPSRSTALVEWLAWRETCPGRRLPATGRRAHWRRLGSRSRQDAAALPACSLPMAFRGRRVKATADGRVVAKKTGLTAS